MEVDALLLERLVGRGCVAEDKRIILRCQPNLEFQLAPHIGCGTTDRARFEVSVCVKHAQDKAAR